MVFIAGHEEYCRWCGTYISSRTKPYQKRGYFFCNSEHAEAFEEFRDPKIVDLNAYRQAEGR